MSTSYATNFLEAVATYNMSDLGILQNLCCLVSTANKEFTDFNKIVGNLGSSVTFDTPPRAVAINGLIAAWQPIVQPVYTLTCDQALNVPVSVTNQQDIFNMEANDYVKKFGKSAAAELASVIDKTVAQNFNSSVLSQLPGGVVNTNSGPYRYAGDGNMNINSYTQFSQIQQKFLNYGAEVSRQKVYLPNVVTPDIIGSGLSQFAPERNNEDARTWLIGEFGTPRMTFYQSNMLPIQFAGSIGVAGTHLTLVSTNDPTGQNVTQLTFSGATANDPNVFAQGDVFKFIDGVSGIPNIRYLTWTGHLPSANQVQLRATAQAGATGGGSVTVNIFPALNWAGGQGQNLSTALVPGMQISVANSHVCGAINSDNALFLAMPRLPDQYPYPTSVETDPDTGASLRLTYGAVFAQNQIGFVHDVVFGSFLVPQYSMRICFSLPQASAEI